ncbi:metal ABC transporter ATP-binding protein [Fictibacillus iocasae]|uniref:Metal ABC transporter ATP-binding protein n=1 Tax=Fictibacillus iocasae TaxID=2715437 RepID=A0ABW2NMC0_9BACL
MEQSREPVISIKNLFYHYGQANVLENINLSVNKGDFLGLVGPNGSGKSSLVKCILGLQQPQKGEVSLFGEQASKFRHWEKIGYVSQKANSFNTSFPATVFEVVSMGLFGKVGLFRFLKREHRQKVQQALEAVGMDAYGSRNIGELSGGQQQRVFIARALVSDPELLILDEPTVGVDALSTDAFYELLKELHRDRNMTLLLVTHDVGVMSDYVTRVACLNKQLHFHGKPSEFKKASSENLSELYGHTVHILDHSH